MEAREADSHTKHAANASYTTVSTRPIYFPAHFACKLFCFFSSRNPNLSTLYKRIVLYFDGLGHCARHVRRRLPAFGSGGVDAGAS